jgi:DNA mismatch repair ATPase MutS
MESNDVRVARMAPLPQAIIEAANRCAALRDDLSEDDKEMIFLPLEPILQIHVSSDSCSADFR